MKIQSSWCKALSGVISIGVVLAPIAPAFADTYKYEYDAEGRLIKVTDGRSLATVNTLDVLGRTTLVTQPKPTGTSAVPTIGFSYDGLDQLKTVTDPRSLTTTYTVTGLGDATGLSSPDTGATTSTYDAAGNLKTRLDARGKTITYTYDALNRLTLEDYPTGTDTSYTYDAGSFGLANTIGRLNGIFDESGFTRFSYDGFGHVAVKSISVGGQGFNVGYTYGTTGAATGKLTTLTYPSGQKINYEYDAAGRLSAVRWVPVDGTATQTVLQSVTYHPNGAVTGWAWGNGSLSSRTYDMDGRASSYTLGQAGQSGLLRTLTYDAGGRITAYNHAAISTTAATNATFSVVNAGGTGTASVNQRVSGGKWTDIGEYTFTGGTSYGVSVQADASGKVYADAVRYVSADVPAHTNVAAAANGATATASSTLSAGYPPIAAINGDRKSAENGTGQGVMWADATNATYPDWLQVHFAAARLINEIDVVTAQDNMAAPVDPTGTTTFTSNGITAFDVQYWSGTAWVTVPGGSITGNTNVLRTVTFTALRTTDIRVNVNAAAGGVSRIVELEAYTPSDDDSLTVATTDNTATGTTATGTWATETTATGFLGTNYRSHVPGTSTDKFTWNTTVPSTGKYRVQARWPNDAAAQATYDQTFGYDDLNRLTSWTTSGASQGYGYDLTGNRVSQTIAASSYTDTIAATSNRLSSTTGPTPAKTNAYDNAGNLTGDGTVTLNYSDRGRLSSMVRSTGTVTYLYNGLGQRVSKAGPTALVPSGTRYYVYDEAGHILGEYQQQGRPIQEFVWLGDMPVGIIQANSNATSPQVEVDNTLTANVTATGTWTAQTTPTGYVGTNFQEHIAATGSSDTFEWRLSVATAGDYDIYARWAANTDRSVAASYLVIIGANTTVYTTNQRVNGGAFVKLGTLNMPVGTTTVRLKPSTDGKVIADDIRIVNVTKPATLYSVYTDHLGAPRVVTNSTGQMVWRWDTPDPFGMTQPNGNPSGLGAFTMNLRLPGQFYDSESGLYQNRFRDYDPNLGRYVQSDPIGLRAGIYPYSYARGRPNQFVDFMGLTAYPDDFVGPLPPNGYHISDMTQTDCGLVPPSPPGASIDANIGEAGDHTILNPWWFRRQVQNKGPWDYKQQGSVYEDFGNFNYGAAGFSMGFYPQTLLQEAGRAQLAAGTSLPQWGYPPDSRLDIYGGKPPYGDDPDDQTQIKSGIEYCRCRNHF